MEQEPETMILPNPTGRPQQVCLEPYGEWVVLPPHASLHFEALNDAKGCPFPIEVAGEPRRIVVYGWLRRVRLATAGLAPRDYWRGPTAAWPRPALPEVRRLASRLAQPPPPIPWKGPNRFAQWAATMGTLLDFVGRGATLPPLAGDLEPDEGTLAAVAASTREPLASETEQRFLACFNAADEARLIVLWARRLEPQAAAAGPVVMSIA